MIKECGFFIILLTDSSMQITCEAVKQWRRGQYQGKMIELERKAVAIPLNSNILLFKESMYNRGKEEYVIQVCGAERSSNGCFIWLLKLSLDESAWYP